MYENLRKLGYVSAIIDKSRAKHYHMSRIRDLISWDAITYDEGEKIFMLYFSLDQESIQTALQILTLKEDEYLQQLESNLKV